MGYSKGEQRDGSCACFSLSGHQKSEQENRPRACFFGMILLSYIAKGWLVWN